MRSCLIPGMGLALAGCVEETDIVDGRQAFLADCAGYHRTDGRGDGPAAVALDQPPSDLTTLSLRNGGTFPRNYVVRIIDGLDRGTHFSAAMPEFGAGDMGPRS